MSARAAARPGLATLFGLDEAEGAALGEIFSEAASGLGFDGARVYAALDAGQTLGQALNLPPRAGEALYARAHNWFAAGRHDRAEAMFRVLCVLDGRDADHWVGYGVCLAMSAKREEADLAFALAAALRPSWGVPHFHAANLAIAQERWPVAAEHLAAFAARQEGCPAAMRQEAARLSAALAVRTGAPAR